MVLAWGRSARSTSGWPVMTGGQMLWRLRAGPTITMAWIRTRAVRMVTAALRIVAGAENICPPKKKAPRRIGAGLSLADSLTRGGRGFALGQALLDAVFAGGRKCVPARLQPGLEGL